MLALDIYKNAHFWKKDIVNTQKLSHITKWVVGPIVVNALLRKKCPFQTSVAKRLLFLQYKIYPQHTNLAYNITHWGAIVHQQPPNITELMWTFLKMLFLAHWNTLEKVLTKSTLFNCRKTIKIFTL